MIGAVCYVDLFAGDLKGLATRIPYLLELGVTYLHLMPLFRSPEGNSDGGYAVSSYREVRPALGTMDDLAALAASLRASGISLVLDFIFNHTSDEHEWAPRALAGDPEYQDYYYIFPDRTLPDAYQRDLRDIFPEQRPGSFTYRAEIDRWVWTTFHSFQWDLNYANPVVFRRMGEEMLFLANQGAEVLRLDAVAFAWKRMGTSLREPARGAPAGAGLQCAGPHRRAGAALQVRGDRAPGRGGALYQPDRVPTLLQPAADGAALGGAGHPRGHGCSTSRCASASASTRAAPG